MVAVVAFDRLAPGALLDPAPLRIIQVLFAALLVQSALLIALLSGRRLFSSATAPWLLLSLLLGVALPAWANQALDDSAQPSAELEVTRVRCDSGQPGVDARGLHWASRPQRWALHRSRCRELIRGDVVRLVDAEGALGAAWRRGAESTTVQGPIRHDQRGWKALQDREWGLCIEHTSASIDRRPDGDGGRIYANRGSCRLKVKEFVAAIADFESACARGRTRSCSWIRENADWIEQIGERR